MIPTFPHRPINPHFSSKRMALRPGEVVHPYGREFYGKSPVGVVTPRFPHLPMSSSSNFWTRCSRVLCEAASTSSQNSDLDQCFVSSRHARNRSPHVCASRASSANVTTTPHQKFYSALRMPWRFPGTACTVGVLTTCTTQDHHVVFGRLFSVQRASLCSSGCGPATSVSS